MDTKTTSIVAYCTWIGLIIAFCTGDKEGAKFHLNQALVIYLFGLISGINFLGLFNWAFRAWGLFIFVCWVIGIIAAINQEEKKVPLIGDIQLIK